MKSVLASEMLEATRLTRAGQLARATALLQRLLGRQSGSGASETGGDVAAAGGREEADITHITGDTIELRTDPSISHGHQVAEAGAGSATVGRAQGRLRADGRESWRAFLDRIEPMGLPSALHGLARSPSPDIRDLVPEDGQFLAKAYSNQDGVRRYKLYVPGGCRSQPLPLVVMLHGCQQSPDDFAAGTRMNLLAEEFCCLVAYPEQSAAANVSKCWNWFDPQHQRRGEGEPALIAGITRQIIASHPVDIQRIYIAGLSAGAAAAAAVGNAYPDLYAAIGVHSGLACGAASDLPSAFAAMRQGAGGPARALRTGDPGRIVPTIVFHGSLDTTVHPRNGDQVIAQSRSTTDDLQTSMERGQVPGGHAYRRTLHADASGRVVLEQWDVDGGGHAWSGGSPAGSFTDPRGPDASRRMLRFFLDHRHPAPGD